MKRSFSALVVILVVAAAFVVLSGQSLPPTVASHFAAGGNANGFMPRNSYLGLMLFITVVIPLLLAFGQTFLRFIPPRYVNLPNREYWLAPGRTAETFAFLHRHGMFFSVLLAAFFCFVHWLVVRANEQQPPHFSPPLFIAGLILFLLAVAVWIRVLFIHFRRCQTEKLQ